MINLKIFVMMLLLSTSIIAVAMSYSQNAMASAYSGQTGGSTQSGMADLDLAEAVEAENTTVAGATDQTTDGNTTSDVQFLSIQNAQSGSLSQVNDTAYTLELNNVSDSTIMFSDRPNRIVESVSTVDFIGNWTAGPDSFALDAPNTALIAEEIQTGELDTATVELFNPMYDMNTNTLTYTVRTENATSINLPSEFGQSILVVDMQPQLN